MTENERKMDWVRLYKSSPLKYNMNALISVFKNDGEKMLSLVLKELGLAMSVDLVKDATKNSK